MTLSKEDFLCENAVIEIIDTKSAAIGVQIQAIEILKMIQKMKNPKNLISWTLMNTSMSKKRTINLLLI